MARDNTTILPLRKSIIDSIKFTGTSNFGGSLFFWNEYTMKNGDKISKGSPQPEVYHFPGQVIFYEVKEQSDNPTPTNPNPKTYRTFHSINCVQHNAIRYYEKRVDIVADIVKESARLAVQIEMQNLKFDEGSFKANAQVIRTWMLSIHDTQEYAAPDTDYKPKEIKPKQDNTQITQTAQSQEKPRLNIRIPKKGQTYPTTPETVKKVEKVWEDFTDNRTKNIADKIPIEAKEEIPEVIKMDPKDFQTVYPEKKNDIEGNTQTLEDEIGAQAIESGQEEEIDVEALIDNAIESVPTTIEDTMETLKQGIKEVSDGHKNKVKEKAEVVQLVDHSDSTQEREIAERAEDKPKEDLERRDPNRHGLEDISDNPKGSWKDEPIEELQKAAVKGESHVERTLRKAVSNIPKKKGADDDFFN